MAHVEARLCAVVSVRRVYTEKALRAGEEGAAVAAAFIDALEAEQVEAVDAMIELHDGVPAPLSPLPLSPPAPPDDNAVDGCAAAPEPVVKRWVARAPSAAFLAAAAARRPRASAEEGHRAAVPLNKPQPAKTRRGTRAGRGLRRRCPEQEAAATALAVPRALQPLREEARPRDRQPGGKGSKLS
ncbi:Staphylococcal-like nuclease CAN2, partial [Frankliniella fusca]